jgi:hypothetical protein
MKVCAGRKTAYLNGMSYEECKTVAEDFTKKLAPGIRQTRKMTWSQLLENVEHDELIYKLVLKYLRRDGFNIGNSDVPEITPTS